MDWQYTSRPQTKPVWSFGRNDNDNSTTLKRPFQQLSQTTTSVPTFGTNQNVPFMFNQPTSSSAPQHPWAPPPHFNPIKAFPNTPAQPEIPDVEMTESSPTKADKSPTQSPRAVAAGALRRVFKSRQRQKQSKAPVHRSAHERDDDEESEEDEQTDDENHGVVARNMPRMSNHYTLNMGTPGSDFPSVLLGYLQFGFNLFLVLVFLYLLVQFIITVQRDLEQRITEYSLDIVHDIYTCAMHYKENHCDNPYPALAKQCKAWQVCMNRDPTIVGRARVGAELIAEVVNGFVEPISWKTLGFMLTSLSFLTLFINTVLSMYKSRHPQGSSAPMPPPPPIYVEPYRTSGRPVKWSQSQSWHGREEPEAPARRRRLEAGVAKIS